MKDEPGPDPLPAQHPLEYFSANAPERRSDAAATLAWVLLGLSWLPFVCGVVNSLANTRTGTPSLIVAHRQTAVVFLSGGLILSIVALIRFIQLRRWWSVAAGLLVVIAQVAVATCAGFGY